MKLSSGPHFKGKSTKSGFQQPMAKTARQTKAAARPGRPPKPKVATPRDNATREDETTADGVTTGDVALANAVEGVTGQDEVIQAANPAAEDLQTPNAAARSDKGLQIANAPASSVKDVQVEVTANNRSTPPKESDDSGSDYEQHREAVLSKRRKKAERGRPVSDTESEDAALDREHSAETLSETVVTPRQRKTGSKEKGTGSTSEDEANQAVDGDPDDVWEIISGPLSKAARLKSQQLGSLMSELAEKIARKYKKSRREIMLAAGLGVRSARARNPFNMFKKYYAANNPRGEMTYHEFGQHMTAEYRKTIMSVEDPRKRAEALQHIWDYVDSLDAIEHTNPHALKSVVSTMQAAKDQFTTLAAAYHNMEEIEVVGAIVYTGPDPAARQTSTVFGGSTLLQQLLDDNSVDVRKVIDRITMYFKSAELQEKGIQLASIIGVNVERHPGEAKRDRDRRVFTAMMQECINAMDDVPSKKMHWRKWLKTAMTNQLRIVNWPTGVKPPGPGFELKTLGTTALHLLVKGYIDHKKNGSALVNVPKFEKWTAEEKALAIEDPKASDIPLVVSNKGLAVRLLRDCSEWREKHRKALKTHKIHRRAGGMATDTESDSGAGNPAKGRNNKISAVHEESPVRKSTKAAQIQVKKIRYEEISDSSDNEVHHKHKKSTHQRSPSRKRARDDDDDPRHARQKEKDRRHMEGSSSEDKAPPRSRKKYQSDDRHYDADGGGKRSRYHHTKMVKRARYDSDVDTESSVSPD